MPKMQIRFDRAKKDFKVVTSLGIIGVGGTVSAAATACGTYLASAAASLAPTIAVTGGTTLSTAAATTATAAATAFAVSTVGAGLLAVGVVGLAYSTYRVIKPRDREKEIKKKHSKEEAKFQYWDCYFSHIGFLGSKAVGKTTLLRKFNDVANPNNGSTTDHYYLLVKLSSDEDGEKVFGFIGDGQGEDRGDRGHQVQIAALSEIHVFLLDHRNIRDNSRETFIEFNNIKNTLDDLRLKEHESFIYDTIKTRKLTHVLILFNMHDIWGSGPDRNRIYEWIEYTKTNLNKLYYDEKPQVEIWPFSVVHDNDVLRLRRFLKDRTILITSSKEEADKPEGRR